MIKKNTKNGEVNLFEWYLEITALIFLALAISIIYYTKSTPLKYINIAISGIICGYILFKKKPSFRPIIITIAWVIGLVLGSEINAFLVILTFIIGYILSYYSFKNKLVEL